MKEELLKIITQAGFNHPQYESNFDDVYEGFEFNPRPNTLVRISYPIDSDDCAGRWLKIDVWEMLFSNNSLNHKTIFSGLCVLYSNGTINDSFYSIILENWYSFLK